MDVLGKLCKLFMNKNTQHARCEGRGNKKLEKNLFFSQFPPFPPVPPVSDRDLFVISMNSIRYDGQTVVDDPPSE
tara:strand:- start:76 stop:300 length:225 start_codon:yes stop_codon:yes gene_type:complete